MARRGGARRRLRRAWGRYVAEPFGRASRYVADRFTEGSSMAAISGGLVNAFMVAPPISYVCLALALLQVLLPDGSFSFSRPRRRRRRSARPPRHTNRG